MPRNGYYSPALRRDLVKRLYFAARDLRVPMTVLNDRLIESPLMDLLARRFLPVSTFRPIIISRLHHVFCPNLQGLRYLRNAIAFGGKLFSARKFEFPSYIPHAQSRSMMRRI